MTAKTLKHKFQSAIADGADTTVVRPSNWNDNHDFFLGKRTVTGTTDTMLDADAWALVRYNNASGVAVSLPQPSTEFVSGWTTFVRNVGSGDVTIDPGGTSTINGGATLLLKNGWGAVIISDGSNYDAMVTGSETVASLIAPMGRLTVTSATPVVTSNVSGATTIYYTPHVGAVVPIYGGSSFVPTAFAEVSQTLADTTKSPAAVIASRNYDIFAWLDGSTFRATRGPAWTGTSRGTGAGTSELVRVGGIWLNAQDITNGPAAQRGTYLGTIATNAAATVDFHHGAAASGGTAASLGVWNAYNRVLVTASVQDNGTTYNYTTATTRQARASTGNQVNYVVGIAEDGVMASYSSRINTVATTGANGQFGIGFDSTTAFSGDAAVVITTWNGAADASASVTETTTPGIGGHYIAALERGDGTNNNGFNWNQTATLKALLRM